jgi:hypothetical protein
MSIVANKTDFVSIVAREISSGIDRALGYWLGRIELEVVDQSLTTAQRMAAIEAIVGEYKQCKGRKSWAWPRHKSVRARMGRSYEGDC